MTTAKICGLSTPETVAAALTDGASHVGFVFFPPSPRHLTFDQARILAEPIPAHVHRVGVFVDPDDAMLDEAMRAGRLSLLQLHRTAPERIAAIRRRHAIAIWAAIAVRTRADLAAAAHHRDLADRVLYDAKTPDGAALPGGMGLRFDWGLLNGFRHPLPWALSGGLDAGNVGAAIRATGAEIVDVSSGVETAPGVKDAGRIKAFLGAVKEA